MCVCLSLCLRTCVWIVEVRANQTQQPCSPVSKNDDRPHGSYRQSAWCDESLFCWSIRYIVLLYGKAFVSNCNHYLFAFGFILKLLISGWKWLSIFLFPACWILVWVNFQAFPPPINIPQYWVKLVPSSGTCWWWGAKQTVRLQEVRVKMQIKKPLEKASELNHICEGCTDWFT